MGPHRIAAPSEILVGAPWSGVKGWARPAPHSGAIKTLAGAPWSGAKWWARNRAAQRRLEKPGGVAMSEANGGPARTRTWDLTVMSGQL